MIEVKERLNVSIKDFFSKIEESVIYDIEQATGKKMIAKDIKKGFKYTKRMKNKLGRKGEVDITISKFVSPIAYGADFKSAQGINKIEYLIEELEPECIEVTYREEFLGNTNSANWNFKLMNFFYKRRAVRRARRMLKAIEEYIQNNSME